MKHLLYIFISLFYTFLFGQNSIGFIDNYSGVQAVHYNPASILDSPYKIDINVLSFSGTASNNYYSINPKNILSDLNFGLNDIQPTIKAFRYNRSLNSSFGMRNLSNYTNYKSSSTNSSLYANAIALGPSFLWNINYYNAVAFTTSYRSYGHANNLDTNLYHKLIDKSVYNENTPETEEELDNSINRLKSLQTNSNNSSQAHLWAEVAFSYAGLVLQTANDYLKFGISLKFLRGIRTGAVYSDNLKIKFDYDENDKTNEDKYLLNFTGNVINLYSRLGANFGMGIDLGFVYEKRNRTFPINLRDNKGNIYFSKAPYRYKLGVSITDIGFLSYNNTRSNIDNPNKINIDLTSTNYNFAVENYLAINSFKEEKKTYYLPTTSRINFDYNFKNHWFLNSNLDMYLLSTSTRKNIQYKSNFTLSARYESLHFSAFLPASINQFGIVKAGIGFRTGYFFIGSSSLFTNLSNYSKEGDISFGFKIPIYNKKKISEYKNSLEHQLIPPPKLKLRERN
ncbi:DUF5723 family protein [Wenyingzhuangia sp. IMCC45467]